VSTAAVGANVGAGRAASRNPPCGLHVPEGATLAPCLGKDEGARAVQAIRRIRAPGSRRWRSVAVYAVTSLALGAASPAQLAG
jgi:hypothetical protein